MPFPDRKGDDKRDTIFQAMGVALSQWETFESALSRMFSSFVQGNQAAVYVAYGQISSFNVREKMVSAAAEFALRGHGDLLKEYEAVAKQAVLLSPERNKIAHGIVVHHTLNNEPLGHFLTPSFYASKHHEFPGIPKYTLTSEDILERANKFANLAATAMQLEHRIISALLKAPPKAPE